MLEPGDIYFVYSIRIWLHFAFSDYDIKEYYHHLPVDLSQDLKVQFVGI